MGEPSMHKASLTLKKAPIEKYVLTLTTMVDVKPTKDARFVISTNRIGLYYFNLVSLFPPTYNNRPTATEQTDCPNAWLATTKSNTMVETVDLLKFCLYMFSALIS
jgi:hypothetical protein